MVTGDNGSHCACSFGSLCPFVEVGSLRRQLALPDYDNDDDDDNDNGNGVTGDDNAIATGDNSLQCTCSLGLLCPLVEIGSLTRRLALPDYDDDKDDDDGNGVMGDNDAMATGDNG